MRRKLLIPSILAAALSVVALGTGSTEAASRKDRIDCAFRSRSDRELDVVALTRDGTLICFEADSPRDADVVGTIRGLQSDTQLVGIDYRPATGDLYGLGDQGGVYIIDPTNARASLRSRLNVALDGTRFGVDFNPTVDRLRIVSDTGQNLRANVLDGTTTTDGVLNYLGPPPVSPALGVTAVAYTNNDASPNTATTLFDIDTNLDQVAVQAPPNAGTLNPTGKLLADAGNNVGFDIYSTVANNGWTVDNQAFASFGTGRAGWFYSVNTLTGGVTPIGKFRFSVVDIAIPLDQL
jgi:Domain of unknown function (DUF4394)